MLRSFNSLALRQLRSHRLRSLLTAFAVMLGVGMVFGVLLLVGTIRATFDEVIDSAWGETDIVVSPAGHSGLMPDETVEDVERVEGVHAAAGMVGGIFTRLREDGTPVEGNAGQMMVAGYEPEGYQPYDFRVVEGRKMRSGVELMIERNWARDRGYEVGDTIKVAGPTGRVSLPVVGIFKLTSGLSMGGMGYGAMPLEEGRRLFDQPTGWMQISVAAAPDEDVPALQQRINRELGAGVDAQTPGEVSEDIEEQMAGLNVVLYFFSGVALFVGGFLILNSFNMTVLQRMRELGMLRTLGASRWMATSSVLVEALAIGLAGTVFGLALGLGLAQGLIALMRGMGMPVGTLDVSASAAVTAAVVGMLVTLLGSFWPARRAGRISPIRAVLGDAQVRRTASKRRVAIGLILFIPGVWLGGSFWMSNESEGLETLGGVTMTMAMFAGMAVFAPFVIMPAIRLLAVPFRKLFPTGGRLAADSLLSNPLRTAATAVALTIGLSVVVVNSSMSTSFISTIEDQMDQAFARDFSVQAQGFTIEQGGGPGVPRSVLEEVRAMPETGTATPVRAMTMDLPAIEKGIKTGLAMGVDPADFPKVDGTPFEGVNHEAAYEALATGGVVIGKGYARKADLARGDQLELVGPRGRHRAEVAGVIDSLGPFGGNEMRMSLGTMQKVYGNYPYAELAIEARSADDRRELEANIAALLNRRYPNLELQSAADAKQEIADEVNKQFGMFNAIVGIAIIVSILGVVNTLAMSVIERTREIGVIRALGASRWQVRRTMLDESLMITFAGAVVGVGLGTLIGFSWVRSMGEFMPGITFHFPSTTVIIVALAAVILGSLAAILPARRAARLDVIDALSYE